MQKNNFTTNDFDLSRTSYFQHIHMVTSFILDLYLKCLNISYEPKGPGEINNHNLLQTFYCLWMPDNMVFHDT